MTRIGVSFLLDENHKGKTDRSTKLFSELISESHLINQLDLGKQRWRLASCYVETIARKIPVFRVLQRYPTITLGRGESKDKCIVEFVHVSSRDEQERRTITRTSTLPNWRARSDDTVAFTFPSDWMDVVEKAVVDVAEKILEYQRNAGGRC